VKVISAGLVVGRDGLGLFAAGASKNLGGQILLPPCGRDQDEMLLFIAALEKEHLPAPPRCGDQGQRTAE
jgi:hypothetical protein